MTRFHSAVAAVRDGGLSSLVGSIEAYVRSRVGTHNKTRLKPFARRLEHRLRYGDAAPRRYRLIHVDPTEIDHLVVPHFWNRASRYVTHVEGGDWDRRSPDERVMLHGLHEGVDGPALVDLENYQLYVSARKHFEDGVPWAETELYEWLLEEWLPVETDWYGSEREVHTALQRFDDLYDHVSAHGYMTQRELRNRDDAPSETSHCAPEHHEIAVDVGRDGRLFLDDGRHRFVVARLLGLDSIPVRVFVRHREWQRVRERVAGCRSADDLSSSDRHRLDHPDLGDVIPGAIREKSG